MSALRRRASRGQALVEFSLTVMIFLVLLMGIFDFGRAIFMYNGVAQAAREIARVTSVHPGSPLGASAETLAVVSTQKNLIPNLGNPTYKCLNIDNSAVGASKPCVPQEHAVKVTISAVYTPVTPILSFLGDIKLSSSSSAKIQ
jgi:NADH/NAD ratio-sensing transcriptional regulator Rex